MESAVRLETLPSGRFAGIHASMVHVCLLVCVAGCGGSGHGQRDASGADGSRDADSMDGAGINDSSHSGDPVTVLDLVQVLPTRGGASVSTLVTLHGEGFEQGMTVTVGPHAGLSVTVLSTIEATAYFPPVPLTECGVKDVQVEVGGRQAVLDGGFEYYFDEDPIVFVHGYAVGPSEWDTMIDRFRQLGYPDDYLAAIDYSSYTQSNVINARDELPPFVADVLLSTGADKVDIVAHSNGGMSTRLWIKLYGGHDKVRDYVSLSGTHHGTETACLIPFGGDSALEQCPAYASQQDSYNGVQWDLNGDPDLPDVDETPFGVEDGGFIHYNALWTNADTIDVPPETCCLNQQSRNDCSDPVNVQFQGLGHMEMVTDQAVHDLTVSLVRAHNVNKL